MNSLELQARPGTPIEYTLRQLNDIAAIDELVVLGSLARAATIGSYEPGHVYSVSDDSGDLRDFDVSAIHGTDNSSLRCSAFWIGAHHVDVTQHFMLLESGYITGPTYCDAASRVLRRPLPGFTSVQQVTREIRGATVRTLPIGVQVVLDTVGSQDGKYGSDKRKFAEFATAMRMRIDTPVDEFPSDRVIDELLQQARWRGEGRQQPRRIFEPTLVASL